MKSGKFSETDDQNILKRSKNYKKILFKNLKNLKMKNLPKTTLKICKKSKLKELLIHFCIKIVA